MMRSILLLGCEGQLGKELQILLAASHPKLIALSRNDLDLSNTVELQKCLAEIKPAVIFNCAAYTAVDKAESEPDLAHKINAKVPEILAQFAAQNSAFLIHISTDYVFDGTQSSPDSETAVTNPLNVYGATKLAGEQAIQQETENHLILRTSWVYGNYGKGNFVKTMLRLGQEREEIRIVCDQIGSPTWTGDLATFIARLPQGLRGIYHYSNSGVASWYDFAIAIFEEARALGFPLKVQRVIPIPTSQYPTPAKRPSYSVLCCDKLIAQLEQHPPHWRESLRKMLQHTQNI